MSEEKEKPFDENRKRALELIEKWMKELESEDSTNEGDEKKDQGQ